MRSTAHRPRYHAAFVGLAGRYDRQLNKYLRRNVQSLESNGKKEVAPEM